MSYVRDQPDPAKRHKPFYMVDAATGLIPQTGLTFSGAEIQVAKNASINNAINSATVLEVSDGLYIYIYDQSELNQDGIVSIKIEKTGVKTVVDSNRVSASGGDSFVVNEVTPALGFKPFFMKSTATGLGVPGLTFAGSEVKTSRNADNLANAPNSAGVIPVGTWGLYLYPYTSPTNELTVAGTISIMVTKTGSQLFLDSDGVLAAAASEGGEAAMVTLLGIWKAGQLVEGLPQNTAVQIDWPRGTDASVELRLVDNEGSRVDLDLAGADRLALSLRSTLGGSPVLSRSAIKLTTEVGLYQFAITNSDTIDLGGRLIMDVWATRSGSQRQVVGPSYFNVSPRMPTP